MDFFNSVSFHTRTMRILNQLHIPGLTVAIVHGKATASRAFGMLSLTPQNPPSVGKPMTTQTLFDIGPASMSLTAAAVALLIADDQFPDVRYDAVMTELLPGQFRMPGKKHTGVTVEDILSHRTGMAPNDDAHIGFGSAYKDNPYTITMNVQNLPTAAPLRSRHMPCSLMYTVASYLVERKVRTSFADFLEGHIFHPLGMTQSNPWLNRARQRGLGDYISPGYWWDPERSEYHCFPKVDSPAAQGAGSIVTNVDDYIKYIRALMNREPPFTEEVYNGLIRPRSIVSQDYETLLPYRSLAVCAAGWEVFHYRGFMVVAHGGRTVGSSATSFFVPALKFGATIFANTGSGAAAGDLLMQEFVDEVMEIPYHQRVAPSLKIHQLSRSGLYSDAFYKKANIRINAKGAPARAKASKQKPGPESAGQKIPLHTYQGKYWSPGWRGIRADIDAQTGQLVIDFSDRLNGFTLALDHVAGQTTFVGQKRYLRGGLGSKMRVEFRLEGDVVQWVGIMLEPELDDYIWFKRSL
ncbi:beta-lactamase/transpeptidase-like protein [Trichoderma citrinoviride]|uniref:Beta-lactamase/transpeptidase-like protein n=1 Tax=Trichoderma citrinoviride TaxID=58853 RepID=A0A2T4B8R7_9HYPO|nr:beta-lactamase/transpeptidase-like protein [Trichoderma citrinoviride]PTB65688.1 beta-lactamase/transpeptidase-like protein [Trichoderma citrinoviride]